MDKRLANYDRSTGIMTTNQEPLKEPKEKTCYRRTSDNLVSVQLIGTVAAITFGFISFQYQSGKIVADVTTKITEQSTKIEALTEDVRELKQTIKDLQYQRKPL
jgi:cell division protein FtsL